MWLCCVCVCGGVLVWVCTWLTKDFGQCPFWLIEVVRWQTVQTESVTSSYINFDEKYLTNLYIKAADLSVTYKTARAPVLRWRCTVLRWSAQWGLVSLALSWPRRRWTKQTPPLRSTLRWSCQKLPSSPTSACQCVSMVQCHQVFWLIPLFPLTNTCFLLNLTMYILITLFNRKIVI